METPTHISTSALLQAARDHVAYLCLRHQDSRLVLQTPAFANHLATLVARLAAEEDADPDVQVTAQLAALFYPVGFRINYARAIDASRRVASDFLGEYGPTNWAITVDECLAAVENTAHQDPASALLRDALVSQFCNTATETWGELHQLERSLLHGPTERLPAAQSRLQTLLGIRYATAAGQRHWQLTVAQQIQEEQKRIDKWLRNQTNPTVDATAATPFSQLESGPPVRAAQTFFRAIYRNHINLSAIADNKANIMISVNSILISVLITFLSYRNIAETQPMVLVPVIVFLVTGLASLVCAVLAARPKVTKHLPTDTNATKGLAFFGNFVQLSEAEFQQAMDKVFHDGSLLYSSMTEDLYHLGRVLDKKYRFLSVSYNIFMVGLIVTVLLFLLTLFN